MARGTARVEAGSRLSGLVPLAVAGVVMALFVRSCFSGFAEFSLFGGSSERSDGSASRKDILSQPAGGSDGSGGSGANGGGGGLDDWINRPDSSPEQPSITLDPDALWEMRDPLEPACPNRDGSTPRHLQWTGPPPLCIDPAKTYTATLFTDRGNIVLELDTQAARGTVNNFVFLARWHYYDGVDVHHAVRDQHMETGDPTGRPPGSGLGPGFPVEDNPLTYPTEQGESDGTTMATVEGKQTAEPGYPQHSVVMGSPWSANPTPGVFFVVTAEESSLPPGPAPFGHVSRGHEVLDAIDETAGRQDDPGDLTVPTEPTVIHRVTITEA